MAKCLNLAPRTPEQWIKATEIRRNRRKPYSLVARGMWQGRRAKGSADLFISQQTPRRKCVRKSICVPALFCILFRLHLKALAERMLRPTSTLWP